MLAQAMSASHSVLPSTVDYVLREQDQPDKNKSDDRHGDHFRTRHGDRRVARIWHTPSGFAVDRASDWLATAAAPGLIRAPKARPNK